MREDGGFEGDLDVEIEFVLHEDEVHGVDHVWHNYIRVESCIAQGKVLLLGIIVLHDILNIASVNLGQCVGIEDISCLCAVGVIDKVVVERGAIGEGADFRLKRDVIPASDFCDPGGYVGVVVRGVGEGEAVSVLEGDAAGDKGEVCGRGVWVVQGGWVKAVAVVDGDLAEVED